MQLGTQDWKLAAGTRMASRLCSDAESKGSLAIQNSVAGEGGNAEQDAGCRISGRRARGSQGKKLVKQGFGS